MLNLNISFLGDGKVASALCQKLYDTEYNIVNVSSRNEKRGKELAAKVAAFWSNQFSFGSDVDVIIVSVSDNALTDVLNNIQCNENTIIVHTAGSYGLDLFPKKMKNVGVFYPLQTFSQGREIDFDGLPFLLETSNDHVNEVLTKIVDSLGSISYKCDIEHRKFIHLAAVFSCNFVNHMLTSGKEILQQSGLPFDIFEHLVHETVNKAFENGPENSQTGPAIRNDINTLKMHEELLSFDPKQREIYSVITKSISETYNKH